MYRKWSGVFSQSEVGTNYRLPVIEKNIEGNGKNISFFSQSFYKIEEITMSKILSIAGLVITIFVAFVCDRWIELLRIEATQSFAIAPYLWIAGAANLLLAIALLALAWYVIFRAGKSILVSSVFVLVGFALTFASVIDITVTSTLPPLGIYEYLLPNSHVLYVAAIVAVTGIAGFFSETSQLLRK